MLFILGRKKRRKKCKFCNILVDIWELMRTITYIDKNCLNKIKEEKNYTGRLEMGAPRNDVFFIAQIFDKSIS